MYLGQCCTIPPSCVSESSYLPSYISLNFLPSDLFVPACSRPNLIWIPVDQEQIFRSAKPKWKHRREMEKLEKKNLPIFRLQYISNYICGCVYSTWPKLVKQGVMGYWPKGFTTICSCTDQKKLFWMICCVRLIHVCILIAFVCWFQNEPVLTVEAHS